MRILFSGNGIVWMVQRDLPIQKLPSLKKIKKVIQVIDLLE